MCEKYSVLRGRSLFRGPEGYRIIREGRYETVAKIEDHLPRASPEMRSRKVRYHLHFRDDTLLFVIASSMEMIPYFS